MSGFADGKKKVSGNSGTYVKFPVDMRLEAKVDVNNNPFYSYWDPKGGETKEEKRKQTNRAVVGVLIGEAMILEGYDEKSGIGYSSTPYFNKQNRVAVFGRGGVDNGKKVHDANADDAASWINSKANGVRKKRVFYVATIANGKVNVIEIRTSIVMAISQMKKLKGVDSKHVLIFTPTHFNKQAPWDKDVKEQLSALINNPRMDMGYADITQGKEIDFNEYRNAGRDLDSIMNDFVAFHNSVTQGAAANATEDTEQHTEFQGGNQQTNYNTQYYQNTGGGNNSNQNNNNSNSNTPDDLPF